jgi:hypothetical protein
MTRTPLAALLLCGGAALADTAYPSSNRPLAVRSVTATSTLAARQDAHAAWRVLNPTVKALDDDTVEYDSAWCEGKPDEGIGEAITIVFAEPTQIEGVYVAAGAWKDDKEYAAANQITALALSTDDGRKLTVAPPEGRGNLADITLGGAPVGSLTLTIAGVKKGRTNDTCISEVELVAGGKRYSPIVGIDRAALAALPATVAKINAALAKCDETVLAASVDAPIRFTATVRRADGTRAEATVKTLATVKDACREHLALPAADGEWFADSDAPGRVSFALFHNADMTWRLAWRDGRWRLVAIDY